MYESTRRVTCKTVPGNDGALGSKYFVLMVIGARMLSDSAMASIKLLAPEVCVGKGCERRYGSDLLTCHGVDFS